MFTLILFAVGYLTIMAADMTYAGHMKTKYHKKPIPGRAGEYSLDYTEEDKKKREFWEAMGISSFLWPVHFIVGAIYQIWHNSTDAVKFLYKRSQRRSEAVSRRLETAAVEEVYNKLVEKKALGGPEDYYDRQALASLESLLGTMKDPVPTRRELIA